MYIYHKSISKDHHNFSAPSNPKFSLLLVYFPRQFNISTTGLQEPTCSILQLAPHFCTTENLAHVSSFTNIRKFSVMNASSFTELN